MGKIIPFPRMVQYQQLSYTGDINFTVKNIKMIRVYDKSIFIKFHSSEDDIWDIEIPYSSPEEAIGSYEELIDVVNSL